MPYQTLEKCLTANLAREALDKRGLSGGSKQERVPLTVNCF
jgi:hypothetical protein